MELEKIAALQINNQMAESLPNRQIIAFYISISSVTPDVWMVELGKKLKERGFAVIGLLTDETCAIMDFEGLDAVFVVTRQMIKYLTNITAFIVTDLENSTEYPKTARVLATTHTCIPGCDLIAITHMAFAPHIFDAYLVGYNFHNQKTKINRLLDNFPVPERLVKKRRETPFYLLGYGYPKLCLMRKRYRDALAAGNIQKDSICFAPVAREYSPDNGGDRVKEYGIKTLRFLLDNFAGYKIIFRPSPADRDDPVIQEIANYFSYESRFSIDLDNDYTATFVKSKAMITDLSQIGSSFHIISKLPAIYFHPWKNQGDTDICSFSQLATSMEKALSRREEEMEEGDLLPFDNSLDELADDFQDFIDCKAHANWLQIERDNPDSNLLLSRLILPISKERAEIRLIHSGWYANYFRNPVLAAFALHCHINDCPAEKPDPWLMELAKLENTVSIYADIDVKSLADVYIKHSKYLEARPYLNARGVERDKSLMENLAGIAINKKPLNL